jgi:hypothetical protein
MIELVAEGQHLPLSIAAVLGVERPENRGSIPNRRMISFLTMCKPTAGHTRIPIRYVSDGLFPGVMPPDLKFHFLLLSRNGRNSSVSIVTTHRLGDKGIEV